MLVGTASNPTYAVATWLDSDHNPSSRNFSFNDVLKTFGDVAEDQAKIWNTCHWDLYNPPSIDQSIIEKPKNIAAIKAETPMKRGMKREKTSLKA